MQKISRTIFVGFLVGVLILGLYGGLVLGEKGSGDPENGSVVAEDSTKAKWKFKEGYCTVAINAHGLKDLQKQPRDAGSELIWSNHFGSNMKVTTESSCSSGYNVQVHASNKKPSSVDVLEDFGLKVQEFNAVNISSDEVTISEDLNDWAYFGEGNLYTSKNLGSVNGPDDDGNLNDVNGTEWIMDYKYRIESDDELNKQYQVKLVYQVSSQ